MDYDQKHRCGFGGFPIPIKAKEMARVKVPRPKTTPNTWDCMSDADVDGGLIVKRGPSGGLDVLPGEWEDNSASQSKSSS